MGNTLATGTDVVTTTGTDIVPVGNFPDYSDIKWMKSEEKYIQGCKNAYHGEHSSKKDEFDANLKALKEILFQLEMEEKLEVLRQKRNKRVEYQKDVSQGSKKIQFFEELIEFIEDHLKELARNNDSLSSLPLDNYFEWKEKFFTKEEEADEVEKIGEEVITSKVPNLPVLSQKQLPVTRGINFQIGDLLSLGTNWEEIDRKVQAFSQEFTDEVNGISPDIAQDNDFFEKRIREIFQNLKLKYSFPRGFDIKISSDEEVNPKSEEDKYRTGSKYKKKPIDKYHSGKIEVYFTLKFPEEIPAWISRSFSFQYPHFYLHDFSGQGVFNMHFGDHGEGRNQRYQMDSIGEQLPFMIQLSQKSRQLRSATKTRQKIQEDPVLDFLYYRVKYTSSEYRLDHLDENAQRIEWIWENREVLRDIVEWIGIQNIKEILQDKSVGPCQNLVDILEVRKSHYLPVNESLKNTNLVSSLSKSEKEFVKRNARKSKRKYFVVLQDELLAFNGIDINENLIDPVIYSTASQKPKEFEYDEGKYDSRTEFLRKIEKEAKKSLGINTDELFKNLDYYFKTQTSYQSETSQESFGEVLNIKPESGSDWNMIQVWSQNGRLRLDVTYDNKNIDDITVLSQCQKIVWDAINHIEVSR